MPRNRLRVCTAMTAQPMLPAKTGIRIPRVVRIYLQTHERRHMRYPLVRTKGYSTVLLDPTQVESKKSSQIQWPVPSINAEPVDIFLGEE